MCEGSGSSVVRAFRHLALAQLSLGPDYRVMWVSVWFTVLLMALGCAAPFSAESSAKHPGDARLAEPASPSEAKAAAGNAPVSPVAVYPSDARWGQADAPVTLLYASDFECPFCARVVPTLAELQELYGPSKLRIVFKHNPLPFHRMAEPAHLAAIVVTRLGGHEAFWRFHHEAFSSRDALSAEAFKKWAVAAGISAAKFDAAYGAPSAEDRQILETHLSDNAQLGITGTPSFLINGRALAGAQPIEEFRRLIDEELAQASALVSAGVPRSHVSAQRTLLNRPAAKADESARPEPVPEPAEEKETTVWAIPVLKTDPQRGVQDALVSIVVFSDFECPFCKRVNPTLASLLTEYGRDLRVVWKDNPLPFHPQARRAAGLARFAYDQGGEPLFWATHDLLFAYQAELGDAAFEQIATQLKYSWPAARRALESKKYDPVLSASQDVASSFDAQGTPHFFINGRRLSGAQPIEEFRTLIEERLTAARALLAAGVPRGHVYAKTIEAAEDAPLPEQLPLPEASSAHPRTGTNRAKVVIQAFTDYECPFCARVHPTLEQVLREHGKDVQIVWRSMPLPFHPNAIPAAEASLEVFAQKGGRAFEEYQALLLANQQALGPGDLEKYATEVGVDLLRFTEAMAQRIHLPRVEADMKVAKDAGINGTPTFVINGYVVRGAQPYEAFRRVIRHALSKQGAALAP